MILGLQTSLDFALFLVLAITARFAQSCVNKIQRNSSVLLATA